MRDGAARAAPSFVLRARSVLVFVRRHVDVPVRRLRVRMPATDPAEALPDVEEHRDEEQDRGDDHDDLEGGHRGYLAGIGTAPTNGSGVLGVMETGSCPFPFWIA